MNIMKSRVNKLVYPNVLGTYNYIIWKLDVP